MAELKLCPFCNVRPELKYKDLRVDNRDDIIHCTWFIRCPQCGIYKTEFAKYRLTNDGSFVVYSENYDGRAQVIEKWNRRANQ